MLNYVDIMIFHDTPIPVGGNGEPQYGCDSNPGTRMVA